MKESLLILLLLSGSVIATPSPSEAALNAICNILVNIHEFLWAIAGGVGVLVITLQGIKWIGSAEDPGVRKQAKQGIIHVIIGLIIVMLAVWIVQMVFPYGSCNFNSI